MFVTMIRLVGWRGNVGMVKVIIGFASYAHTIAKKQSIKGLVLQLKVAQVLLQQSMGGYKVPNVTLLGQRVSRNGSGLPRKWIPRLHRKRLMNGDPLLFKVWMTLFGLYRVLEFPGKVNLKSIVNGHGKDFTFLLGEYSEFVCRVLRPLVLRNFKNIGIWGIGFAGKPLEACKALKTAPFVISSSSPAVTKSKEDKDSNVSILSTSPAGILLSVKVWFRPENDMLREYLFN